MQHRPKSRSGTVVCVCSLGLVLTCVPSGHGEDDFARVCREKMQLIYQATMRFVAENDGYLPPAWMAPAVQEPFTGQGGWFQFLKIALAEAGEQTECGFRPARRQPAGTVFHCAASPYWYGGNGPNCVGYAWNRNLGMLVAQEGKVTGTGPYRLADIADKDRTVLLVDAGVVPERPPYCHYHAGGPSDAGAWHNGKVHVLFLDGHTEALSPQDIKPEWFVVRVGQRR